jgi:hypothetical protein
MRASFNVYFFFKKKINKINNGVCGPCESLPAMDVFARINFLTPQLRSKIKKILFDVVDSNGKQHYAFEICYDMLLNAYDNKTATIHDVMQWLQSIEHYHADLTPIVTHYAMLRELKVTERDLRFAYEIMIRSGWQEHEIEALWDNSQL